jgi:hypothetical protein
MVLSTCASGLSDLAEAMMMTEKIARRLPLSAELLVQINLMRFGRIAIFRACGSIAV